MMPFDLATILATVRLMGADSDAYRALFNHVITLFGDADQATLQAALAEAAANSDRLHAQIKGVPFD